MANVHNPATLRSITRKSGQHLKIAILRSRLRLGAASAQDTTHELAMNSRQCLEFVDFIEIGRAAWGVNACADWLLRQRVRKEPENSGVPLFVVDRCEVGREASGNHLIRGLLCSFLVDDEIEGHAIDRASRAPAARPPLVPHDGGPLAALLSTPRIQRVSSSMRARICAASDPTVDGS
jgi:hypothetical protein